MRPSPLTIACPKCLVRRGWACTNTEGRFRMFWRRPHKERKLAAKHGGAK